MRRFNVTGICIKDKHYMVDISNKISKIMELIEEGHYFTINRARQYGKSTTLHTLRKSLPIGYTCINLSFEGVGETMFSNAELFCQQFIYHVVKSIKRTDESFAAMWEDKKIIDFYLLSAHVSKLCAGKKIILIIDEVDKASGSRVFLHFLGMLRSAYLAQQTGDANTFHSVILAGVYDIKNIKLSLVNEGSYENQRVSDRIYNSPWNIAVNFNVDMSFNPAEIAAMLATYESDHNTGMEVALVANEIHKYTSGYPFLVSRICKCIDEELDKNWTIQGVRDAIKIIIYENNTLFDDLSKNLENNKELYDFLYNLLFIGKENGFNFINPVINLGFIYGYVKKGENNRVVVSNKIFEICLHEYFLSKNFTSQRQATGVLQSDVVKNGQFNMELCLCKFADHYAEIWSDRDAEFIEREGRILFLSFIKPLINGHGFYHIESQFADFRRMDLVVDFGREQFIVELKLWRGEANHDKAYEQLLGYLKSKGAKTGYLLTFDFRKGVNKKPYKKWLDFDGIRIFDVVV